MNKFENDIYPIVLWIITDKNDKDIKILKNLDSDDKVNLGDNEDGSTQSVTSPHAPRGYAPSALYSSLGQLSI